MLFGFALHWRLTVASALDYPYAWPMDGQVVICSGTEEIVIMQMSDFADSGHLP